MRFTTFRVCKLFSLQRCYWRFCFPQRGRNQSAPLSLLITITVTLAGLTQTHLCAKVCRCFSEYNLVYNCGFVYFNTVKKPCLVCACVCGLISSCGKISPHVISCQSVLIEFEVDKRCQKDFVPACMDVAVTLMFPQINCHISYIS